MSGRQNSKRQRTNHKGSYRDTVPLADDYIEVRSREGRLRKVRAGIYAPAPTERAPHPSTGTWSQATSWHLPEDPEYALDPDAALYNNMVERDIMEEDIEETSVLSSTSSLPRNRKERSKVSKRPNVVWTELHRQSYLDEMLRWAGRADFRGAKQCSDCVVRGRDPPECPEYRCKSCFLPDLSCLACTLKRHRMHPFHRIEKWTGDRFIDVSLKSLGLHVQLNHASMFCSNPVNCHQNMLVLHSNGFHEVSILYCGCDRAIPHHLQLLRRALYPASQIAVRTCATFELLELLHKMALTTKASTYDFYRALEKLTNNTGISVPMSRYRALFRMNTQFRHLKMLKWAGRGHDPTGVKGTAPGELAVACPSCPRPGINLPVDWELGSSFLYMMFVCMDANFRLKNQIVSNYSQDPGLGTGWAYVVPRAPYDSYVLSRTNDEDISTCVGLQALAQAHNKFSQGLRYTGVGGAMCGRSEMILPLAIGNLQKGERYANMDYVFGSAIRNFHQLLTILVSYDIACQWFVNLFKRMTNHWPEEIRPTRSIKYIPAIPKLHEPMHDAVNHQVYSLNYIPGVGLSDLEVPERVWGSHNALGNSTKTQGPGTRHDTLDDNFGFWNWLKYSYQGPTLMKKYKRAVADFNIQTEGHRGLTESLDPELVKKWELICVDWENDVYPKTAKNPYYTEGISLSEFEVRKELAEEEERRMLRNQHSEHETSASQFVLLGLELEELQRRIHRLAKKIQDKSTARQSGGLTEQRNLLRSRLRVWEGLFPLYMPGLPHFQSKVQKKASNAPQTLNNRPNPEDAEIWLPSRVPANERSKVVAPLISNIEERIRIAQASDCLDSIRHTLKVKTRMIFFKNKNVRGQYDGTRSRAVIDRIHEKAVSAAEKYRAARAAKMSLSGPGEWEKSYRVLDNKDIRGYQDLDRMRQKMGRRGILEDDVHARLAAMSTPETEAELSLEGELRTRRDGTGETRRTLSWIWTTKPLSTEDEGDDILRVEWSKSRARALRAKEELMLVKEEMRRVLAFLDWKAEWWRQRQVLKDGVTDEEAEGIRAYALSQASLQEALSLSFQAIWIVPLSKDKDENTDDSEEADGDEDDEASDEDPEGIDEDNPEDAD